MFKDKIEHLNRKIKLIGAAGNWGGFEGTCQDAPLAIKKSSLIEEIFDCGINMSFGDIITSSYNQDYLHHMPTKERVVMRKEFHHRVKNIVSNNLTQGYFPTIIGGDHSVSFGFWQALSSYYENESLVMLLIDGKLDVDVDQSSVDNRNVISHIIENVDNLKKIIFLDLNKNKITKHKLVKWVDVGARSNLSNALKKALSMIGPKQKFVLTLDLSSSNYGENQWNNKSLINLEYLSRAQALTALSSDERLLGVEIYQYDPGLDPNSDVILEMHHLLKNIFIEL